MFSLIFFTICVVAIAAFLCITLVEAEFAGLILIIAVIAATIGILHAAWTDPGFNPSITNQPQTTVTIMVVK